MAISVADDQGKGRAVIHTADTDPRRTLIRRVLHEHAGLGVPIEALTDEADLFQAGMTSHSSVNLMLALEDTFDVEFPDSMLMRNVFGSVEQIAHAIGELMEEAA